MLSSEEENLERFLTTLYITDSAMPNLCHTVVPTFRLHITGCQNQSFATKKKKDYIEAVVASWSNRSKPHDDSY